MYNDTSYGDFAYIYDMLTDDVQYKQRADYIHQLATTHLGKSPELLCDLGCGTGTICSLLQDKGYDCIGIDNSENMLNVASAKNTDGNILFLNQDICSFELYGTVDVFISMLDTLNYITNPEDLLRLFMLVNNYLNPGGIFIFDVNTRHKFENILGNNTFVFEKDNVFYTWDNYYEGELLEFHLDFFVGDDSGKYTRFSEEHCQRYYSHDYISYCAEKSSLCIEAVYGDLGFTKPADDEERIFYILKKPQITDNQ